MKLDNHIANRLLYDDKLAFEIAEYMHPNMKGVGAEEYDESNLSHRAFQDIFYGLSPINNKSYWITDSVFDKLDLLKVSRTKTMLIRKQNHESGDMVDLPAGLIIKETKSFDWTVFASVKRIAARNTSSKYTFILPTNECFRLVCSNGYLGVGHFALEPFADKGLRSNFGNLKWSFFWINMDKAHVCEDWEKPNIQRHEEFLYKLMCFLYLSENEEVIVAPGQRHGTRKSGKVINTLKTPITVVTSKWNITSIRNEGFDVSGHFRMQPFKTGPRMIWIDPFQKHGYVRKAKSEDNI